jgi:hypothetical protein
MKLNVTPRVAILNQNNALKISSPYSKNKNRQQSVIIIDEKI